MKKRIIFKFIGGVFSLLLKILSYSVPKKKNKVLLGSNRRTTFIGNSKYLFLYLCRNQNELDFAWVTSNRKLFYELKNKGFPVVYSMSFSGLWAILRSNFLFCTHGSTDLFRLRLRGKFNIIMLSHGTSIIKALHAPKFEKLVAQSKDSNLIYKLDSDNEYLRYHTVIASSNEDKQNIIESRMAKNIVVLGYPRNDIFFENNLVYENYNRILNLQQFTKVILYCPTFRDFPTDEKPFSKEFLIRLNEYLDKEKIVFLIKGHINEKSLEIINDLPKIKDISEDVEDIQDILPYVDLLISDYSSIFFDFVFRGMPMIFYPYDFESYTENSRNLFCDYFKEMVGPFATNEDELFHLILSSEKNFENKQYKKKFDLFKKRYNKYTEGKNCERVYKYVLKLIA